MLRVPPNEAVEAIRTNAPAGDVRDRSLLKLAPVLASKIVGDERDGI